MADQANWLEAILKRESYNESPLKVIAIEGTSNVVGKGDNYLSIIERMKATVLLGSGKTKKISIIVKKQHETEQMKKLAEDLGVFFRETMVYRDVLPQMEELLNDINDDEDVMWAKCLDFTPYNRLVFEDLNAKGYKMADRKKQLGLNSALLVIRNLAKFHALSRILLDRGQISAEVFGKHIWTKNPELTAKMTQENGERLVKNMRTWGSEWQEACDRLEKALPSLGKHFVEALEPKPDEFIVLCHGDCWTNNMLFKGDIENPTSFKFVDLQVSFMGTPTQDLHYFLTTSVRIEVTTQHLDLILQSYVDAFEYFASKLNLERSISIDSLKEDMKKKMICALTCCLIALPITTGDTEEMRDLESIIKAAKEAEARGEKLDRSSWDITKFMSENAIKTIKSVITDSIAEGIM